MMFGYSYSAGGVWAGYIPTILASVEGGYGANYNTTVEVGTGGRRLRWRRPPVPLSSRAQESDMSLRLVPFQCSANG